MVVRIILAFTISVLFSNAFASLSPLKSKSLKTAICEEVAAKFTSNTLDLDLCLKGAFFKVNSSRLNLAAFVIRVPTPGFAWSGLAFLGENNEVKLTHVKDANLPHFPCSEELIKETLPKLFLNADMDSDVVSDYAFKANSLEYEFNAGVFDFTTVWEIGKRQFSFNNKKALSECK